MQATDYSLAQYVSDIRAIANAEQDGSKIAEQIRPLARKLATTEELRDPRYRVCDEKQGFGVHLLHEEDNHELGVFVLSWLPNRGTLPHNHLTWAVVAVMEGEEYEVQYKRLDDGSKPGYARLEENGADIMRVGDVSVCKPDDIHSVWNKGADISISLHTYGKHINHTGRSQFDLQTDAEIPYTVTVED